MLSEQTLLFAAAEGAALCAILLIVLLAVSLSNRKKAKDDAERITTLLQTLREEAYDADASDREHLVTNLRQLYDSLLTSFANMNRTQGEQMNAVIRQSYDSMQASETRQQGMQRIVSEALGQNEQRMEKLRLTVEEGLRLQREDNSKQLTEMRKTVDEKLNDTLEKRLSGSFAQVSERLEQVYRSLGEVHSLASGVGDLKRVLTNVKTRGVWGEIQLGALLSEVLTEKQYRSNVAVVPGSGERVEFAVCLPGREENALPVYLPIDSKFPQEDFARLTEAAEAGDASSVEAAQKALLAAVRTEAKRIGKYIAPPHTTDFAVMFLPLESLYAEVMRHSDVVEAIQREQRILISGPSTLLALLNSLQMGFRTLAIEQRSAEVWRLLGAVKSDFGSFSVILQKTQEKLQQASSGIDSAFVKTRSIEKRLRGVESLSEEETRALMEPEHD